LNFFVYKRPRWAIVRRLSYPSAQPQKAGSSQQEDAVAKGQQRSNREKKKPKQDKKKVTTPATPIGSTDQRGKPGRSGKKG
jgi:hypothetical protein